MSNYFRGISLDIGQIRFLSGTNQSIFGTNGSSSIPAFGFSNQADGIFYNTGSIRFTFSGLGERASISSAGLITGVNFQSGAGNSINPGIAFTLEPGTGLFRTAGTIGISTLGTQRLAISTTTFTVSNVNSILAPAGSVTVPMYSFSGSTNTGMYLISAGNLGLSAAGIQFLYSNSAITNVFGTSEVNLVTGTSPGSAKVVVSESSINLNLPTFGSDYIVSNNASVGRSFKPGSTQDIKNNAWMPLTIYDVEDFQKGASFEYSAGVFKIPISGLYLINAVVSWPSDSKQTSRSAQISIDDVPVSLCSGNPIDGDNLRLNFSYFAILRAGSLVSILVLQQSGGTITIDTGAENYVNLTLAH